MVLSPDVSLGNAERFGESATFLSQHKIVETLFKIRMDFSIQKLVSHTYLNPNILIINNYQFQGQPKTKIEISKI